MSRPIELSSPREQLLADLSSELESLDEKGLRRRLTTVEAVDGPLVRAGGRLRVSWCSNDYLGLASHPAIATAAAEAATSWGVGARASGLLGGTTRWHVRLEVALATWFGAEAAIVYPSGYLANLGTLSALLSRGDLVLVDRLAHASLIDAIRATGATWRVFRHNDTEQVAHLLGRLKGRRRFIVTEGVFSMDGDRAPLGGLASIAEQHGALVYLDDAHGAFVEGAMGRGSPEAAGVPNEHVLYMGTLGKALGSQGGFVVGPAPLIDHLRNHARTFIYATALAVPSAAAALEALRVLEDDRSIRHALAARCRRLYERMQWLHETDPPGRDTSLDSARARLPRLTVTEPSHILPVVIGTTERAMALSHRLWEAGMWCPAIRPPTVAEGTARLRLSVTALHSDAQVDALASALHRELTEAAP